VDGSLTGLLGANALMLVAGLGLVGLRRAAVAYLAGIALCGVLAAELAVVGVAYGWTLLAVTAAVSAAYRIWRLRSARGGLRLTRPSLPALAACALLLALVVRAWPSYTVQPFDEYDGWAMWAMKARALYLFGWADPTLFAAPAAAPLHLDYPLFLPALEALGYRTLGGFDTQLVHVQFLLLAVASVAALAWVLRGVSSSWVVWSVVVAAAAAPNVLLRLLTGYADLPLALLVAPAVAAAARWLLTRERFLLELATLLFAAAALTKNEGLIFVLAAYVGLLVTAPRLWRPLLVSALALEALLLPWQVYVAAHGIQSDSVFASAFRFHGHLGIGPIALRRLVEECFSFRQWTLLAPLFALALLAAALRGSYRIALFGAVWAGASLAALTWIYVSSSIPYSDYLDFSADRIVSSLVLGAVALVPLLVGRPDYPLPDA
jgi:hypothetical protein